MDMTNREFTLVGRNGYRAEEVDAYIASLQEQIRALKKEKSGLENKMIVLADKIEEYRADEDSLRAALLGAQRFGDQIVKDAKAKAEEILNEANKKATEAVSVIRSQIEDEKDELVRMQIENSRFRNSLLSMYEEQIRLIRRLPEVVEEKAEKEVKAEPVAEETPVEAVEELPQEIQSTLELNSDEEV